MRLYTILEIFFFFDISGLTLIVAHIKILHGESQDSESDEVSSNSLLERAAKKSIIIYFNNGQAMFQALLILESNDFDKKEITYAFSSPGSLTSVK